MQSTAPSIDFSPGLLPGLGRAEALHFRSTAFCREGLCSTAHDSAPISP